MQFHESECIREKIRENILPRKFPSIRLYIYAAVYVWDSGEGPRDLLKDRCSVFFILCLQLLWAFMQNVPLYIPYT